MAETEVVDSSAPTSEGKPARRRAVAGDVTATLDSIGRALSDIQERLVELERRAPLAKPAAETEIVPFVAVDMPPSATLAEVVRAAAGGGVTGVDTVSEGPGLTPNVAGLEAILARARTRSVAAQPQDPAMEHALSDIQAILARGRADAMRVYQQEVPHDPNGYAGLKARLLAQEFPDRCSCPGRINLPTVDVEQGFRMCKNCERLVGPYDRRYYDPFVLPEPPPAAVEIPE